MSLRNDPLQATWLDRHPAALVELGDFFPSGLDCRNCPGPSARCAPWVYANFSLVFGCLARNAKLSPPFTDVKAREMRCCRPWLLVPDSSHPLSAWSACLEVFLWCPGNSLEGCSSSANGMLAAWSAWDDLGAFWRWSWTNEVLLKVPWSLTVWGLATHDRPTPSLRSYVIGLRVES